VSAPAVSIDATLLAWQREASMASRCLVPSKHPLCFARRPRRLRGGGLRFVQPGPAATHDAPAERNAARPAAREVPPSAKRDPCPEARTTTHARRDPAETGAR
jgi:hypothetical protein